MRTDLPHSRRNTDEAERPFWISYADLMTALMILFLVIMVTTLASMSVKTQQVLEENKMADKIINSQENRLAEISSVCDYLSGRVNKSYPGVFVDCKLNRINFGEAGRFQTDQYKMNADGVAALQKIVPLILETANTPLGKKWLKQVLIEGYTDTDGSYLYNLNLSLKRSEWVMCSLLRNDQSPLIDLSPEQRRVVKKLFLAGGVAFNDIRGSKDASRRVELRLQFHGVDTQSERASTYEAKFDDSNPERCML
jgi:outer membrane protein OmpA-like peptidoglycan-associated protein